MPAGVWQRPEYYQVAGQDRLACIRGEAHAVRNGVGLIDVGTLGKLEVIGPQAAEFLERVYTSNYANLKVGMTRYAVMCDESGVVIDDGVVARLADDHFYFTTTTSGAATIYRELSRLNTMWRLDCGIVNHTGAFAAVNLAGPKSREVLKLTSLDLSAAAFPYLAVREGEVAGIPARLMRVGFVGEWGYEIHVPASMGGALWDALMQAGKAHGIRPFGVEAQRLLRLEKGHIIISQDTDGLTTPLEVGMDWAVKMNKPFFVGQRSLAAIAASRASSSWWASLPGGLQRRPCRWSATWSSTAATSPGASPASPSARPRPPHRPGLRAARSGRDRHHRQHPPHRRLAGAGPGQRHPVLRPGQPQAEGGRMSAHPRPEPGGRPRRRHAPPPEPRPPPRPASASPTCSDRPPRLQGPRRRRLAGKPRPAHPAGAQQLAAAGRRRADRPARLHRVPDRRPGRPDRPLAAAPGGPGVYPVLRQDAALIVGSRLDELLRQTCNVNFRPLDPAARPVVLTSMVGVGVTAIPEVRNGLPARASGATAPTDITCGKPCSASPSSWAAAPLPPQLQLNRPNPTQLQESGNDAHRSQAVSRGQRRQVCAGPVCRHPRHGQDQGRSGRPFREHPHHRRRLCGLRGVGPRHRAQRPGLHGHRRPGHSPWCPGSPATPASPATAT
jgi:glycine cleavage system aminomethyltransferase T